MIVLCNAGFLLPPVEAVINRAVDLVEISRTTEMMTFTAKMCGVRRRAKRCSRLQ